MKQAIIIFLSFLLLMPSIIAISVQFTIIANGVETKIVQKEIINQSCVFNNETNATECTNQTATINETKTEPWSSKQDVEVDCESSCNYQIPTFIVPSEVDIKNYTLSYNQKNNYIIVFKNTNKTFTDDSEDKVSIKIKQSQPEVILQIEKIAPKNLTIGTNQVNILIRNLYDAPISSISAEISGSGIITVTSIPIQNLAPNDRDYVFLTINASEPGVKEGIVKLSAQTPSERININYAEKFLISSLKEEEPTVNLSELAEQLSQLKNKLKEYEAEYSDKKVQGYLVSEVGDSIKSIKEYLQNAQIAISENNSGEAKKYILLARLSLSDVKEELESAKKIKKSFLERLKENMLLVSSISAGIIAITTLIGLLKRQMNKVKKLKKKIIKKKKK